MRIAYLAQRVPYPPDRGDKIATYHQVRYLSNRHEVDVFCLAQDDHDIECAASLSRMVAGVHTARVPKIGAMARCATALLTAAPLTPGLCRASGLERKFETAHRRRPFDVVLVYSSSMAQYVERHAALPRVMEFADLDSLKWAQYAERSPWPLGWVYARESRLLLAYERRIAHAFGHSIVCTQKELADLRRLVPDATATCIPNGVDLEFFRPMTHPREAGNLVFTGVMDYRPNVDAMVWFTEQVLPRVRAAIPSVTLTICGARPTRRVRKLADIPGVEVTGRVPDVRQYLARATVCVVPLRIARGIQNKLLEAMAMGLPCVATRQTAEGLSPDVLPAVRLADDADQFAAATTGLLRDREAASALGRLARTLVETHYRWDVQVSKLEQILVDHAANIPLAASHLRK
jgi:sugar transferase (PEP-CTERM/EpsH1 system associated)